MLTYSMAKIRRFTKKMEHSGIFANEKLMLIHVLSFIIASQLNSLKNTFSVIAGLKLTEEYPIKTAKF